jgi:hypothetical protein
LTGVGIWAVAAEYDRYRCWQMLRRTTSKDAPDWAAAAGWSGGKPAAGACACGWRAVSRGEIARRHAPIRRHRFCDAVGRRLDARIVPEVWSECPVLRTRSVCVRAPNAATDDGVGFSASSRCAVILSAFPSQRVIREAPAHPWDSALVRSERTEEVRVFTIQPAAGPRDSPRSRRAGLLPVTTTYVGCPLLETRVGVAAMCAGEHAAVAPRNFPDTLWSPDTQAEFDFERTS